MGKKTAYILPIKKNAVICSGFVGVLCLLFFTLSAQATFYEIRGTISWKNKTFKNVNACLLYGKLPAENDTQRETAASDPSQNSFTDEYVLLEKRKQGAALEQENKDVKKARQELRRDFENLVKKYLERKIDIGRKGEFYLNVNPGSLHYLVVFRKMGLLQQDKHIEFWVEKIYFNPGDVMDPKEMILNETNVIVW